MTKAQGKLAAIDKPTGLGSVTGVPHLPAGFADTFESSFHYANGIRIHTVMGGKGPPLLLISGWPQTWYSYRALMPILAKDFKVIAVDIRGFGLTEKPDAGYDPVTVATDMLELMTVLGHERFAVVGHDLGMWLGYFMSAEAPDRVERFCACEANIPGLNPSFPAVGPKRLNDFMWHYAFNRATGINEQMIEGRERTYFLHQFYSKSSSAQAIPEYAINHYIELATQSPIALRGTFKYYEAFPSVVEYCEAQKLKPKLKLPVLAIAGSEACNEITYNDMAVVAENIESVMVEGCGHFMMEEDPEAMLEALLPFLEPYKGTAASA